MDNVLVPTSVFESQNILPTPSFFHDLKLKVEISQHNHVNVIYIR